MAVLSDITMAIGCTPLIAIKNMAPAGTKILAKCEFFNPCSSVKDRIATAMIADGETKGLIKQGTTIIEPTSGNTGIGLAFVCAAKGYKLVLTMPESMSVERRKVLAMLGATIVLTDAAKGMRGAVEMAGQIVKETPNSYMPQQFNNPANPEVHRKTTAEEIWYDTDGNFDYFVAGIGTGGTITGCGEVFKSRKPEIKVVGIEPADSAVLSGGKAGPHKIQGIGAGFIPTVLNRSVLDEVIAVTSEDSIETARQIATQEGMLVGISSGAAMVAALQIASRPQAKGKTIIVVLPDTGERYISTDLFK